MARKDEGTAQQELQGRVSSAGSHSDSESFRHYIVEDDAILNKLLIQSNGAVVARSPERVTLVNGCERKTLMADENPQYEYEDYAIMELYEDLDMSSTIQMACVKRKN